MNYEKEIHKLKEAVMYLAKEGCVSAEVKTILCEHLNVISGTRQGQHLDYYAHCKDCGLTITVDDWLKEHSKEWKA